MNLIGSIVTGFGICTFLGFFGYKYLGLLVWLSKHGEKVPGLVFKEDIQRYRSTTHYVPFVAFTDKHGVAHQFRSRFGGERSILNRTVPVTYDPDKPDSRVELMIKEHILPSMITFGPPPPPALSFTSFLIWFNWV